MAWPLMQEHSYLGASIDDGRVISYLGETPLDEARKGVCLYDLSGCLYSFVSGEDAHSYIESLCAGTKLPVASCGFSAVLTGDGALVSVPLAVRGGEHEYMLLDVSDKGETLKAWMGFVQGIERQGSRPFEGVAVEDATDLLVPLMLLGERVDELIGDYTGDQALPSRGQVASIAFDRVPCVLAHLDAFDGACYIVFAPPSSSVRLFRSFLSFTYVHPQGMLSAQQLLDTLPWGSALRESDRIEVPHDDLASWSILRPDADYIGARGILGTR